MRGFKRERKERQRCSTKVTGFCCVSLPATFQSKIEFLPGCLTFGSEVYPAVDFMATLGWGHAISELGKRDKIMHHEVKRRFGVLSALVAVALLAMALPLDMAAQDDDDPPGRAARLGHMVGSVSFQPAGESEWVEAIPNRPMTTGDKLWADQDSRAEVQLGSTSIHLNSNTGFSFLNLDDRTIQIQLSAGAINVRVRHLNDDDVF